MNLGLIYKAAAWLVKNSALVLGVIESILKVISGIVTLTPTKKDDAVYATIDSIFSKLKKPIYKLAELLAKKA